jgi:NADH-quinone oxidoreductase subunit G
VVDLCPVGSLVSKDFLHKARAWDLDRSASLCPGCSQGCNITIDTRDDVVVRFRPRANLEVNRHFICDEGRASYRGLNRGDRVEAPLVRTAEGRLHATDWDQALAATAAVVRGATGRAVIIASGRASIEALGRLQLLTAHLPTTAAVRVPQGASAPLRGVPGLSLRADRAPNAKGAELLGYSRDVEGALEAAATAGLVVLLDVELTADEESRLAGLSAPIVVIGTVAPEQLRDVAAILPSTTFAEESGVWVNADGRAQRYAPAKAAPAMARPAWWIASAIATASDDAADTVETTEDAFATVAARVPALAGLRHADLGWVGRVLPVAAAT